MLTPFYLFILNCEIEVVGINFMCRMIVSAVQVFTASTEAPVAFHHLRQNVGLNTAWVFHSLY